jgi:DNA-binding NarL/FixJ family response regulator
MSAAKILLAEDHTIVMEVLKALLEPEFQVVGSVDNGRDAVKAAAELKPDVVVLDVSLPHLNGIEAARQIRKVAPGVKIVFLTMHEDIGYMRQAFDAGASAYVVKHSASLDLQLAIRKALLGRTYITPGIAKEGVDILLNSVRRNKKEPSSLTPRQREIVQLLAEGRSAKETASILHLSPRTVEFHKYRLMERLGIENTAQLLQFAIKNKIVIG